MGDSIMDVLRSIDPDINCNLGETYNHTCSYVDVKKSFSLLSTQNNFSVLSFNIRSYFKNIDETVIALNQLIGKVDIIVLTETWVNSSTVSLCKVSGYKDFHIYRKSKVAGGVSIFVNDNLSSRKLDIDLIEDNIECMGVSVYCDAMEKWVNILGVYRPPSASVSNFNTRFNDLLERFKITEKDCVITGDFNICLMNNKSSINTTEFNDIMQSHHLLPLITCPTRVTDHGASLIDHVWTNIL